MGKILDSLERSSLCDVERKDQWDIGWNDIPYEHNALGPYSWGSADLVYRDRRSCICYYSGKPKQKPKEPWEIIRLYFRAPSIKFLTPHLRCYPFTSNYSVYDINNKAVPWLRIAKPQSPIGCLRGSQNIYAGTSIIDFLDIIEKYAPELSIQPNLMHFNILDIINDIILRNDVKTMIHHEYLALFADDDILQGYAIIKV